MVVTTSDAAGPQEPRPRDPAWPEVRSAFLAAAGWFAEVVGAVGGRWGDHGLGVWTVRDLVGHSSRALLTVLSYLDTPADEVAVDSAAGYFDRVFAASGDPASVAERGRQAGQALGPDPLARVRELVAAVQDRLGRASGDERLTTPVGGMRLADYLPTRTFELTVHGLDLASALGLPAGEPPDQAATATWMLLGDLARRHRRLAAAIGGLTGRRSLPDGFSLLDEIPDAAADRADDPVAVWTRLREANGRAVTVIDLYQLVAERRGLQPHELPREERLALARSVGPVVWPGWQLTEQSERTDPIRVVDPDDAWPARFHRWREWIASALGPTARRIDHVGSTAVPGLPAKPIIDVQVSVADLDEEAAYVPALEGIGVQLRSRDALHRYFRPFPGRPRDVHVHVCAAGSNWEREHLLFRDYLRAHPDDARRYAHAKREAARCWADDGWAYTDAKGAVILDILEKAESWAAADDWPPSTIPDGSAG
jgi:GrpB-like predicted nucleotidyltransferase (UPF0157 family)